MSVASLSSPITLVIPSRWVVAGILLCCSILFSIGLRPRKEPLFLAFGALCMTISGFMTSTAVSYSAATVPEELHVLRVGIRFAMLSLLGTMHGNVKATEESGNSEEWSTVWGLFARSPCVSGLSRRCG